MRFQEHRRNDQASIDKILLRLLVVGFQYGLKMYNLQTLSRKCEAGTMSQLA
jgi:hypothetical protein